MEALSISYLLEDFAIITAAISRTFKCLAGKQNFIDRQMYLALVSFAVALKIRR